MCKYRVQSLNCSKLRSTTLSDELDLPCSADDEDCDEFSGDEDLTTVQEGLIVTKSTTVARSTASSRPSRRPSTPTDRPTRSRFSSTIKSTSTADWRPWTTAGYPEHTQPTSPDLVLPRPSTYPDDVEASKLDELDQLKLNVALIIGVAICFSLLLLILVLVVYRYRTIGAVVGGRRARSSGDKAAAAYAYETCNMLPPPTPVAVDPGRPLIVVNRAQQSAYTSAVSRPPVTDATTSIARRDVKEWFV